MRRRRAAFSASRALGALSTPSSDRWPLVGVVIAAADELPSAPYFVHVEANFVPVRADPGAPEADRDGCELAQAARSGPPETSKGAPRCWPSGTIRYRRKVKWPDGKRQDVAVLEAHCADEDTARTYVKQVQKQLDASGTGLLASTKSAPAPRPATRGTSASRRTAPRKSAPSMTTLGAG